MSSQPSGLGSLAQSARGKTLSQARRILVVIGILTIGVQAVILYMLPDMVKQQVDKEVAQLQQKGQFLLPGEREKGEQRMLRLNYIITGGTIALGVVFVILGIIVYQFPVPATVLGLVLYVGATIVFMVLTESVLMGGNIVGILIRLLIVLFLFKAVQSAIAYQKAAAADLEPAP